MNDVRQECRVGYQTSAEPAPDEPRVSIEIQPVGCRANVTRGTTLLAAVRAAGVEVVSVCGGYGLCSACRVFGGPSGLTPPTEQERALLSPLELSAGARLACQAVVVGDVRIDVPAESLSALQRLQLEGTLASVVTLDPAVVVLDVQVPAPTLDDLRSDATRLSAAVSAAGENVTGMSLAVLASAPTTLRAQDWAVRAVVHHTSTGATAAEMIALLPRGTAPLGAAIDIGTTKLAAYVVDLESGETVAKGAALNPQVVMGEDVMSRIAYAASGPGAEDLHGRLLDGINRLLAELRGQIGASVSQLVDAVAVGNTAMHHSFAGLPLRQLGTAPYVPAVAEALELRAADTGLELAQGALVYIPPNIAGFVGADHTAALLASNAAEGERTVLVVDIGTNTEITVACGGQLWTCSCASGPAFEGAHIRDGMRAAVGAIERVGYFEGRFQVHTIGDSPPAGICGSGILDAVVAALGAGVLDERGRFFREHPLVSRSPGGPTCTLVPCDLTAHGRDIVLTRADVGEIQLAKAAIRAGTELLLSAAGIHAEALEEVVIAGAFGTYLDVASAIAVGMLPRLPRERFRQVGNAAGQGAQQLLVSRPRREKAGEIARRARYVELTTHPGFADMFAEQLPLRPRPVSPELSRRRSK